MFSYCWLGPTQPLQPLLSVTSPPSRLKPRSHRYYVPLRLPKVPLRRVRFSLSTPDTLPAFFLCVSCDSFAGESIPLTPGLLISRYPSSSGCLNTDTFGSPEFPSYPFESMPWSKTPVVTSTLALTHSGLLPSAHSRALAFSRIRRIIQ